MTNFSWADPGVSPLIVAHRGASGSAPENTMAAFKTAVAEGARALEIDVRLSADNEIVIIHDSRLNRTTDGHGLVSRHTLAELKQLSAGKWYAKQFAAERIPTLRELFEFTGNRIGVNIEIKQRYAGSRRLRGKKAAHAQTDIVARCIAMARQYRALESIAISSFDHRHVRRAAEISPRVAAGVLVHIVRHFRLRPSTLATRSSADFLFCSRSGMNKILVNNLHAAGVRVGVYTVNTGRAYDRAVRLGADVIFSNHPGKFLN
jgi:glycerophosphoryl diester phosphodiesterase